MELNESTIATRQLSPVPTAINLSHFFFFLSSQPGIELCSLQWGHSTLTTGPQGIPRVTLHTCTCAHRCPCLHTHTHTWTYHWFKGIDLYTLPFKFCFLTLSVLSPHFLLHNFSLRESLTGFVYISSCKIHTCKKSESGFFLFVLWIMISLAQMT